MSLTTSSDKAAEELSLDVGTIKLKLGEQEVIFDKGEWIPGEAMTQIRLKLLNCYFITILIKNVC